jgi:LPXTG-motif cell wall-anchored protein
MNYGNAGSATATGGGVLAYTGGTVSPFLMILASVLILVGIGAIVFSHRRNRRDRIISTGK